ncbi:MAG TPA: ATP-binding protein, partial [Leptospiraceae bacterium]|nr:ATP-binding protein [Leptospiraceae bacterium]
MDKAFLYILLFINRMLFYFFSDLSIVSVLFLLSATGAVFLFSAARKKIFEFNLVIFTETALFSAFLVSFGDREMRSYSFLWFFLSLFFCREALSGKSKKLLLLFPALFTLLFSLGVTGIFPAFLHGQVHPLMYAVSVPLVCYVFFRSPDPIFDPDSLLSVILDSIPVNIFIKDMEGRFIFLNSRTAETLGSERENIEGKTDFDFLLKESAEKLRAFDKEAEDAGGTTITRVEELRKSKFLLAGKRLIFLPDERKAILGFSIDISEQMLAEKELHRQKLILDNVLNTDPNLIFLKDQEGRFLLVNRAVETAFEMSAEEIINQSNYAVHQVHEEVDYYAKIDRQVLETMNAVSVVESFTKSNGEKIWYRTVKTPLTMSDGTVHILAVSTDINEIVIKEQELIKAKEAAENLARIKSDFLSTMSHEIRTPLNALVGLTHIMLNEEYLPSQQENLHILSFSAEHLLTLVNDILDFSKIEAGKVELESVEMNPALHLKKILQTLNFKAQDSANELNLFLDEKLPETVISDPFRLSQIFTNLISNSIKFTNGGKIDISAYVTELSGCKAAVRFQVSDSGIGISADKIETVFGEFSQADSSTSRRFGGTGLGLAITKKLLNLFGSEIRIESTLGKGTSVFFDICFEIPEAG